MAVRRFGWNVLLSLAVLGGAGCAHRCAVKPNETAELYPTYASYDAKDKEWRAPVHGRIYQPAVNQTATDALALFRTILQLPDGGAPFRIFEERAEKFLIKAPEGRAVGVNIADKFYGGAHLDSGGHFEETVRVPEKRAPQVDANGQAAAYQLKSCNADASFDGQVFFIPEQGTSVVATLEDTLQVANLNDRTELLKNLLFRDYRAVDGMQALLSSWRQSGAVIHYVTATPWQLFQPISNFLQANGFPAGPLQMTRWGDSTGSPLQRIENVVGVFAAASDQKNRAITQLMTDFPKRRFILVGNTASDDAKVFADVARRYPDRIQRIFLRKAPGGAEADARAALSAVPAARWTLFSDPKELSADLTRL
jgi:hypothetical protein